MRVDIPEHKTFVDFPDGTPPEEIQAVLAKSFPPKRGVMDVLKAAGSSVAAGVNQANASILERMSKGARAVEGWTGLPAGGAFESGAQTAREGADYWRGKARGFGISPNTLPAKIYEGVGSAPAAIAEFVAGVPMAAASGAVEGGVTGAVKSGLERFAVGKVFKGLEKANLSPVQRSGAMAGTMAAQTAAEGGNLSDVAAAGITGLALSAPTEGGRAARVRQNLQRAGVQPEIAQDLAGRSANVVPEGMGYVDTTNMDRAVPGDQPARPLVLDAEAAPRAVTVRPAERGPVLDAENASRITRDPMIPGGPGDAASIEAARLRIEHPDWKDADVWEAAQRTVLANGERVPAATERDTVGVPAQDQTVWDSRIPAEFPDRRGPVLDQQTGRTDPQYVASSRPFADAERAPRPEEPPRFYNPEVLPTPTERDAQPAVREPVATAEDAPRPAPLNPLSMENPPVFNHDSLPTAAVTAADSLTVPPSVKAAVVGTPAEISALVQPGKAVLRNGDKAYLIDRAEAAKQFGSLAEAKKMLLAGGDAEAAVLGYPKRPEGVPLTTEAVTKSGEILTEPEAIKAAASAGDVAYAAESTPAEVRAATERVAEAVGKSEPATETVNAVTLLHAGVHIPTLVKQVYDKYFRKLDADAAPGSVKEFLDKNRDANRRWGVEPLMRWMRRAGVDQAANAQMELMRIGTPGEWARREFDAISGATAKSALVKERFRDDAMAGMSLRERQAMADLVAIERDLAIDASGKTGYTFIGGKTPAELAAAKQTFQTDYKLTPAEMARVQQATAKYFEAWKDRTQRMLDAGLISAQEKADLDAHLYSPKQFLDKIDPFVSMHGPGGKVSVPDSGIHRLKEGSDAYFRNDPVALLEEAIDRTETRIARNDANKALAALPAGNGITEPAVRVGAKDWAEPPAGYETIRYMENGKQQAINVREDFAREWAQADPLVNSQLVNAIGWLSGASAVRAGSTGHNPLFAIANFPVDAMTIFLQADKRGYSPHAPVAVAQMARNVASVARDAWKHEGRYEQWVNEKGAREMLSNYGGITSRRAHLSPLMQKVSDVTSKIGRFSEEVSRLAYREQLIKNGVAPAEASKIAGEYVDFSRGGSIIKAVDRLGLPYLNAGVQGTRSVARAAGRDPVRFAYKAAQLLVGASALYGINQLVNPTGWANVSDREKADNFIIMLPPYFNYTDKDGTTVTPYIRIKKEQSVRPLLSMAEALWQMTHEGKDATQQVEMAFGGAVPVSPDKLLPPVAKMYLAYAANLDVYRKENVWRGKQEIEPYAEYTANTNPILTRIGKETQVDGKGGVSPERLGRAVGQVIVPSNLFAKTGGALLTSAYEKMNPQERAEFGKTNYEHLVDFMKGTRLLGGAKDTEQFREGIREARMATNTQLFEMNKPLDAMVLKYAKEGMKDPAQYEKILAYIDAAPPEHQDRLESRMEDVIETANLPDRGWWLSVKALSPEDRADQFKARLAKVDAAEQERMMQIAEELSGFTSDRFWERYDGSP